MTRSSAHAIVIALALVLLSHGMRAQPVRTTIRGHVVAAENDRPLRRALIVSVGSDSGPRRLPDDLARKLGLPTDGEGLRPVFTDDDGRFEIELGKATASIAVSKAGYVTMRMDVRHAMDRELEMRLSRGAAISGKVVDESGIACIAAQVAVQRVDATADTWTPATQTDDLGEYRIGGLPAGRYTVSVRSGITPLILNDGTIMESVVSRCLPIGNVEAFRMSATVATRTVNLQTGDDRSGVDLVVRAPRSDVLTISGRPQGQASRGRIEGRVTAPGGEPIAGALVRAVGTVEINGAQVTGSVSNVTSDVNGNYSLRSLPDGTYQVEAREAAHVDALDRVAADSHPGRAVRITDGSTENIDIELVRGGVITGTIVDSAGDPLQGVRVSALQLRHDNGRLIATKVGSERATDDRGRYRVFGLTTGSYLLAASANALASGTDRTRHVGFANVYYPGTAGVESAQPLQVRVGSELTGIDLTFASSLAARVSGVVQDSAGEPLAARVQLTTSSRSGAIAVESFSTTAAADGSFELRDVPPGEYVLQASAEGKLGRAPQFGSEFVAVVDRDPPSVMIRTSPGATLEGRFISDAGTMPPMRVLSIQAMTIDIDRGPRAGRGPGGLAVHEDGQFYLTGLHGEMRFALRDPPPGWYVKSFTIGGVDVTDRTFDFGTDERTVPDAEILLSSSGATIAGVVSDRAGARVPGVVAVAWSTNPQLWFSGSRHVKQRRVGPNGSFEIDGLPSGEYWVVAIDRLDPGDWQSPEVLDALVSGATRVNVREGQVQQTDLRLSRRAQ
ncbi:MAG TPA: carboxypeptidase-like regulatory domain-containing protein [Vicinamibacterales bacterium]|nr:carboxypeptidase-like regulatory domain-containing protein [Vicinamibacterales bacterium]